MVLLWARASESSERAMLGAEQAPALEPESRCLAQAQTSI